MKYLQQQLKDKKGKIVWLASYPKSGNTWFRCFISALFTGEVDLAKLKTDGIFSNRQLFDRISNIDSRLLTDREVRSMIPEIYIDHAKTLSQLAFVKVHDAYILNDLKKPIFPKEISHKVVYLVRNPLDVVGSFAHHNASSIPQTINLMNNPQGYLAGPVEGLNINLQFRQLMLDWSGHVKSWTEQKEIEVILVRYEDMLNDTFATFRRIVDALEIEASDKEVQQAIDLTSFSKLKAQEEDKGFKEKNIKAENFFRSGKTNQYETELTVQQINRIKKRHLDVMSQLNYTI